MTRPNVAITPAVRLCNPVAVPVLAEVAPPELSTEVTVPRTKPAPLIAATAVVVLSPERIGAVPEFMKTVTFIL